MTIDLNGITSGVSIAFALFSAVAGVLLGLGLGFSLVRRLITWLDWDFWRL